MRWRRAAGGLGVAIALVGLLVYGVGWENVLENVQQAHPATLIAALAAGIGMLALRGLVVKRLLVPIGDGARGVSFVTAFLSGYFARSALPWGRSTGTPITAYLLAANSDSKFEDNLAVVATAEVFNFVASLLVVVLGFAVFATTGGSTEEVFTNVLILGSGGAIVAGALIVAVNRGWAKTLVYEGASRCETLIKKLPRVPADQGILTDRVEGFFTALERIQASRRTLVAAFSIAIVGWIVNALPLYFALLALGVDVSLALVFVCAPLASFGGILPVPGGTGGIEVVLASLLIATAGVSGDVATAAAILYRLTTYWTHLVVGGFGAVYLSVSGTHRVRV
ncbi:lysylphosphatidylglycerol synthase transmembrane domain-containing protein [Halostagnicola sp. A-GB9-2]|uniref:lysylphosphatidylglycerol synthase transmembrane domain-containing protein n=1 Tax=Halostagnicola sp. A-GB9-2 TaxID=3048066 RepID=UPI0024C0AB0F|nr:lysylphosphatidylglycerol synthase transmembrane domain-containing protein [Halostagnicola sp. A-GB9-2]MDJ1432575.1 lysylphosphatidylglycerol synthase transmembrane domain-containing protein [Halostagnicola sp. A-GB9-2]